MAWKMGEVWRGGLQCCNAMVKWPGLDEPSGTDFALAHSGLGVRPYLSERSERLRRLAGMIGLFSRGSGLEDKHIADGYSTGDLPDGVTVVDVGGSHGVVACDVARQFPSLHFVFQVVKLRVDQISLMSLS